MYTLKAENPSGEVLNLSASRDYTCYKIEGLAPPQATFSKSTNSTQDGTKITSRKIESRNIVLYISLEGDIEKNRIALYNWFLPKSDVKLYFSNGTRNIFIEGVVEVFECDMFSQREYAQISIICPKPYFKSVDEFVTTFSDVSRMFSFPFAIEKTGVELSSITTNVRKSIINTGDVESGLVIELFAVGTVTNPVLYDVLERTFIKLNFTMQESDTIVINTNIGEKSISLIRDGVKSNAMGYLSPDSTWFKLKSGDNVFTYSSETGASNLQIKFTTSILYGGV